MIRRISAQLHLYAGLLAGLLLVPIGLTGSVLVFSHEIDEALHPAWHHVEAAPGAERASADAVAAAIRAAYPQEPIARMELPGEAGATYEAVLARSGRHVYVDPYTAEVVGAHGRGETLTGWLHDLHVHLLAGNAGRLLVGVVGLVLIGLAVTGLVLWWRGRRHVRRGLTVRWRGGWPRINYDLHGAVGVYTLIPLVVVAFTGAGLIFYGAFTGAAHRLTGTPLPPPPPTSVVPAEADEGGEDRDGGRNGALPSASLDAMLNRAQSEWPEGQLARIDFPRTREAAYRVRLRLPGELHPIGLTMAFFDRYSGALLRAESALEVPAARRFGYVFYPLHIGSYGGLAVRLVYVLLGLAPVLLAVTGTVIWWRRQRKKRRRTRDGRTKRHEATSGARPPRPASLNR